jgi:hypothetical protein
MTDIKYYRIKDNGALKNYTTTTVVDGVKQSVINTDDIMIISRDRLENSPVKEYATIPINDMQPIISKLLEKDTHLYEMLPPNQPVKPYFDIDFESDLSQDDGYKLIIKFLEIVIKLLKELYGVDVNIDDYLILNSCRKGKISYHIIEQNKIYFSNVLSLKTFIYKLIDKFDEDADTELIKSMSWIYQEKEKRYIFDKLPYSSFQNFRLINQSKMGTNHTLKSDTEIDYNYSLIRLYHGTGDRILIPEIEYGTSIKKVKSKKNGIKNNTTEEKVGIYIDSGITLMQKHNLSFEYIKSLPEYKQYLYLIPNTAQPRDIFRNVGFAIASSGGNKEDFREWASLSKKHLSKTGGQLVDSFHTFAKSKDALNIDYLKKFAKKSCPDYFDEHMHTLEKYFNPNYDGMRIIKQDTKYIEVSIKDVTEQIILLKSQLGSGKTSWIKEFIKVNKYKRILFPTSRIALTQHVCKEFNSASYLDKGIDLLNTDVLTISMESLHKLEKVKKFDLIVMDECEANLSVFSSPTMRKNQIKTFKILTRLIKESKKSIFAGGFITQKSIDYINYVDKPTVAVLNTRIPDLKTAIRLNEDKIIQTLIESIIRGEKNYVVYSSLKMLNYHIAILKGIDDSIVKEVLKTLLIYSSETDDSQLTTLRDIHNTWGASKLIMVSPSITVGNSYCPDIPDFTNVFFVGCPTCIVADNFQAIFRVRKTTSMTMYFSLPSKDGLSQAKKYATQKFNIIKEFNPNNKLRKKATLILLKELIEKKKNNLSANQDTGCLELLFETISGNSNKTPIELLNLMMFNNKENVLSDCYYEAMFYKFLKVCNYKVNNLERDLTEEEQKILENYEKNRIFDKIMIQDIPIITETEMKILKTKQDSKKATNLEKLQISLYHFNSHMSPSVSLNQRQKLFDAFQNNFLKIYFYNLNEELSKNIEKTILYRHGLDNCTEEDMSSKPLKEDVIFKLNQALGIVATCFDKVKIERSQIEALNDYLYTRRKIINTTFNFNNTEPKKWEFKHSLSLIKQIYKSWTGYQLIGVKDKHTRNVTHCITQANAIWYDEEGESINPFIVNTEIEENVGLNHTESLSINDNITTELELFESNFAEARRGRELERERAYKEEDRIYEETRKVLAEKKRQCILKQKQDLFNNQSMNSKKPDIIIDEDNDYLKQKRKLQQEYDNKALQRCIIQN